MALRNEPEGMRLALLANPRSGAGTAADAADALERCGAHLEVFDLGEAERAIAARPDRVVVAGGDGSIGCAAAASARASVPLAVLPAGTANDFARALGLPDDLDEAVRLAVTGARTRRLDLARIGDRPFVNVASLGLAPVAARKAHGLKRAVGQGAYVLGALRAALVAQPVRCVVRCDGAQVFDGLAWQATVACTGAFGGGAEVDADPRDGKLDLVVIEAASRLSLARRAYGLRRGTIGSQRGVHTWRARRVELDVPPGTEFNVDGEVVAPDSTSFSIEPAAFELVVG